MYENLYIETVDPVRDARLLALAEAEDDRCSRFTAVERAITEVQASARKHCERMNEDRAGSHRAFLCLPRDERRLPDPSKARGFSLPQLRG